MSARLKFAIALIACVLILAATVAALGAIAWTALPTDQRALAGVALIEDAGALLLVSLLLITVLAMALHAAVRLYVTRPLLLAEETRLISGANPRHRLDCTAPAELARLASAINALADRCETVQAAVDTRVAEANREIGKERNLLAALMADLTESVVVFNAAGSILLYNQRAPVVRRRRQRQRGIRRDGLDRARPLHLRQHRPRGDQTRCRSARPQRTQGRPVSGCRVRHRHAGRPAASRAHDRCGRRCADEVGGARFFRIRRRAGRHTTRGAARRDP
ncbi:MAG: hypothetical protein ACT4P8_21345 [Betaproteobacteria bacterium]